MSFTQDELQALNSIVEQKLSLQRRELERTFEQRLSAYKRDIEQKLMTAQQDVQRNLTLRFTDQQRKLRAGVQQTLDLQQVRTVQSLNQALEKKELQQHQYLEELLERSLAAQLLAFEQQVTQRLSNSAPLYAGEPTGDFDAIEVQTEIPWEDLVDLIDKVLDERLSVLSASLQTGLRNTEQALSEQIVHLRSILMHAQTSSNYGETIAGTNVTIQDLFESIVQLEHIVESLQVAMTANSALLSNRLYHHQQLPLERAHPKGYTLAQKHMGAGGMSQLSHHQEED